MSTVDNILEEAKRNLRVLSDEAPLLDAANILSNTAQQMVVIFGSTGTACGIVTRADIVKRLGTCNGRSCLQKCADIMTRKVEACHPSDLLSAVWQTMNDKHLQSMPVLCDEGQPIGIITAKMVLEKMMCATKYEEKLLKQYVMGIGYR